MPPRNDGGSLADADIRLFNSGLFADATIVCGDHTWKVHKNILSSRCKWFKAAFHGNLAEATSGTVVLREQDPELVGIMLRFIYARRVDITMLRDGKDVPALCVEIFRVADFFLIDELAKSAKKALEGYLSRRMNEDDLDSSGLAHTLAEVLESIRRAYQDGSTKPLRQIMLYFLWMRKDRYLQTRDAIALLNELPELGTDLMKTCLSVDLTTSEPIEYQLPRSLPVLEAVRNGFEAYSAGGPSRDAFRDHVKLVRTPCVLRPHRDEGFFAGSLFSVMDSTTEKMLPSLSYLVPSPTLISKISSNESSSIVQVLYHRATREAQLIHIRFVCPADAKHYVKRYCNTSKGIREKEMAANDLELNLSHARDDLFH